MLDSHLSDSKAQDFSPFTRLQGNRSLGLLIVADHAKSDLPQSYGCLGLAKESFEKHIAFDIGIEAVARGLHECLDVPVVMANFSRLLIDPNRGADDPTLVMRLSDGEVIPDNATIGDEEIQHRIDHYHGPYHKAITSEIEAFLAEGIIPILLSLHSFTPNWRGQHRRWHAGVLWDQDARFVMPLLSALKKDSDLIVGDNEPYTGKLKGDCMYVHGTMRGLAHALLEIRQDLITSEQGQIEWIDRLAKILSELLSNDQVITSCRKTCHFGSYSD